jgi:hypothetical protein
MHLYIDVGFIFLSPTEPHYTSITYPGTYILMWDLFSYRLLNHITPSPPNRPLYGRGLYITVTYVTTYILIQYLRSSSSSASQPASHIHLTQTVYSVRFKFPYPLQRVFTPTVEWSTLLGKQSPWGCKLEDGTKKSQFLLQVHWGFFATPWRLTTRKRIVGKRKRWWNKMKLFSILSLLPFPLKWLLYNPTATLSFELTKRLVCT